MDPDTSYPPEMGLPSAPDDKRRTWVQTERQAHEAWSDLIAKKPRAAMLLHYFVAHMGHQNAVVINQKLLAKMLNVTDRTVRTAVSDLVAGRWIQTVQLHGKGAVNAYVVNDKVAWCAGRDQLRTSIFSATVIADVGDQKQGEEGPNLRRLPALFEYERQLPIGPAQSDQKEGDLPDLPALRRNDQGGLFE